MYKTKSLLLGSLKMKEIQLQHILFLYNKVIVTETKKKTIVFCERIPKEIKISEYGNKYKYK